jgi:hypothetical protein
LHCRWIHNIRKDENANRNAGTGNTRNDNTFDAYVELFRQLLAEFALLSLSKLVDAECKVDRHRRSAGNLAQERRNISLQ